MTPNLTPIIYKPENPNSRMGSHTHSPLFPTGLRAPGFSIILLAIVALLLVIPTSSAFSLSDFFDRLGTGSLPGECRDLTEACGPSFYDPCCPEFECVDLGDVEGSCWYKNSGYPPYEDDDAYQPFEVCKWNQACFGGNHDDDHCSGECINICEDNGEWCVSDDDCCSGSCVSWECTDVVQCGVRDDRCNHNSDCCYNEGLICLDSKCAYGFRGETQTCSQKGGQYCSDGLCYAFGSDRGQDDIVFFIDSAEGGYCCPPRSDCDRSYDVDCNDPANWDSDGICNVGPGTVDLSYIKSCSDYISRWGDQKVDSQYIGYKNILCLFNDPFTGSCVIPDFFCSARVALYNFWLDYGFWVYVILIIVVLVLLAPFFRLLTAMIRRIF